MCIWMLSVALAGPLPAYTAFYGAWAEVEVIKQGRSEKDARNLAGHQFSATSWTVWSRHGELSPCCSGNPGPRIDRTTWPMRVDIRGEVVAGQKPSLRPGIFTFARGRLVIALGPWTEEREWPRGADYPSRPKDFASTKANGTEVWYLKPCLYLDQD